MSTEPNALTPPQPDTPPEPLRLLAMDVEDLQFVSAALQDAILRPVDIVWERSSRQVTLTLSRFCWECGGTRVMASRRSRAGNCRAGPNRHSNCWPCISSRPKRRRVRSI